MFNLNVDGIKEKRYLAVKNDHNAKETYIFQIWEKSLCYEHYFL